MVSTAGPTGVNTSRLVRLLAAMPARAAVAPSQQSFGERLSAWLGWADAISLCAVLDGPQPGGPGEAERSRLTPADALARLRAELAQAIAQDTAWTQETAPADFQPYRERYLAHQQAMAARVADLRDRVRQVLAGRSPRLQRLVELDRVLDKVVGAQERQWLSTLPGWLEQQFEPGCAAQAAAHATTNTSATPATTTAETSPEFSHRLRALLLAELELRLQPVQGLIEALQEETTP